MEEKPRRGRRMKGKTFRQTFNMFVSAENEDWLNKKKEETGLSWGEIIEGLVHERMDTCTTE